MSYANPPPLPPPPAINLGKITLPFLLLLLLLLLYRFSLTHRLNTPYARARAKARYTNNTVRFKSTLSGRKPSCTSTAEPLSTGRSVSLRPVFMGGVGGWVGVGEFGLR